MWGEVGAARGWGSLGESSSDNDGRAGRIGSASKMVAVTMTVTPRWSVGWGWISYFICGIGRITSFSLCEPNMGFGN